MQVKISKTLEGIIARAAFNTTKAGIDHSLKDFLMLEMLREEGSLAYQLLSSRLKDWELYQVRLRIEREVLGAGRRENTGAEEFYRAFTDELCAVSGATRSVSTAHALRAIVGDRSTATSRVLEMYGITGEVVSEDIKKFAAGDDFRTEIQVHMLDFGEENKPEEKNTSHVLDKFGVNLTQMAREGKIDPVVGREQEIERVVQILSRRKKNNPILIGEAGVGKSAIIEGLALRIAGGEVPYTIADKTLFSLDVSSLVAGTKFRGEFEERMQQLLDELRKAKDTIIFIDEIHTIVGAGSTQGSLDTANILKPALARGELQTIGATTLDEYRENIESDSALERRFQKVVVEPTTPEQTLQILRNIAPHYEQHHKVRYTEEALQACVELTGRYITDRFFPDKAIDVLDEAGSRIHLQSAREPAELRQMESALDEVRRERDGTPKPDFVMNDPSYSGVILVAGKNFGSGSSREHAAWAIAGAGFRVVISSFFADIHKNNELNNLVLPVVVSEEFLKELFESIDKDHKTEVKVDLPNQTVTNLATGKSEHFEINGYKKHCLENGLDDVDFLVQNRDKVEAWEAKNK